MVNHDAASNLTAQIDRLKTAIGEIDRLTGALKNHVDPNVRRVVQSVDRIIEEVS